MHQQLQRAQEVRLHRVAQHVEQAEAKAKAGYGQRERKRQRRGRKGLTEGSGGSCGVWWGVWWAEGLEDLVQRAHQPLGRS